MISSMIRKTVAKGQGYAVRDLDSPGARTLAVAWHTPAGWSVAVGAGRIVAERLSKTVALNLMHETASHELDRAATRALLAEVAR